MSLSKSISKKIILLGSIVFLTVFLSGQYLYGMFGVPNSKDYISRLKKEFNPFDEELFGPVIDFRLHEKSNNVSVYNWCLSVVAKKIYDMEQEVLRKIGCNRSYYNNCLKSVMNKKNSNMSMRTITPSIVPIDDSFLAIIDKFFNCNIVKEVCGNCRMRLIVKNKNEVPTVQSISVDTEKLGVIQIFVCNNLTRVTNKNIYINIDSLKNSFWLEILVDIGHELGHIFYKHMFKKLALQACWDKFKSLSTVYTDEKFDLDIRKLRRLQEVQADVFAILGDFFVGKGAELYFRKREQQYQEQHQDQETNAILKNSIFVLPGDIHPSYKERHSYYREIADAMSKELKLCFDRDGYRLASSSFTKEQLYLLGNIEANNKEYKKAYAYFSALPECETKQLKATRSFLLGKAKIQEGNFFDAYRYFSFCVNHTNNSAIKANSIFELEVLRDAFGKKDKPSHDSQKFCI